MVAIYSSPSPYVYGTSLFMFNKYTIKGVFFVIQLRTTRDIEFYKALFTTCKLVRDIGQRSPNS